MAENFDDFVERVREANPIEEVIEASGIHLRGHGRLRQGSKHDSLNVRTDMQRYFWYSRQGEANWSGDVFAWVMLEKGCEFMEALEMLARQAHLDMPRFQTVNEGEVRRQRAAADVFTAAAGVFQKWLVGSGEWKADEDALKYARSRGWTDETIAAAMVGCSGRKSPEQLKDMRGEFDLHGIDHLCPAAVAVTGFEGDIEGWAAKYELVDEARAEGWIEKGRIHGLMDTPGLMYAHQLRGGIRYLSRRQLPGFDSFKSNGKVREWKSFNPHKALAGPREFYLNHAHRTDRSLVCVEGQGDAITFGQWGFGSLAFCGLLGDPAHVSPEDGERMRRMAAFIRKHPAVYLCLDEDEAGAKAVKLAAQLLGPKVQILRMSRAMPRNSSDQSSVISGDEEAGDGEA